MADIPRRQIDELALRWSLAKIPQVVVEGPSDRRFLRLYQSEDHCPIHSQQIDFLSVDTIEIPPSLLQAHGLDSDGARQRVIACIAETSKYDAQDGFRGIVDSDLDLLKGDNVSTPSLWYTDYGCMDCYCWTPIVLKRVVIQTKSEGKVNSKALLNALYNSITQVCRELAIIRFSGINHLDWMLKMHRSDKSLSLDGCLLKLDRDKYLSQCGMSKEDLIVAKELVLKLVADFDAIDPLLILNGHDLLWLLEYALRELSSGMRRDINQEIIKSALVTHGVADTSLASQPVFVGLDAWAKAAAA